MKIPIFIKYMACCLLLASTPSLLLGQTTYPSDAAFVKSAKNIHTPLRNKTLFCQLPYDEDYLVPLHDAPFISDTARRVRWRRIISTRQLMAHFGCPQQSCRINHKVVPAKQCCLHHHPSFKSAYYDLHNILPVIPKVATVLEKATRYHFQPNINNQKHVACGLYWQENTKSVILTDCTAGIVARIHLYMQERYELDIPLNERLSYLKMHRSCPSDAWEQDWNQAVKNKQGDTNPFIK